MSIEQQLKASAAHVEKLKKDISELRSSHQTEIDNLSTEILTLRKLNATQSEQLTALRDKTKDEPKRDVDQVLQVLIDGFKNLNVTAKPPTFHESQNPQCFLEKLEKFFVLKNVTRNSCMFYLDEVFSGKAKLWYDSQKFNDYDGFKKSFMKEFYSVPVQVRMKSNWLSKRFNPATDQLNSYFLNQIRDAQYFTPKLENYELHYTVIQQLPTRAREILSTVDFTDVDKITDVLSQLDVTFSDQKANFKRSIPQSADNKDKRNDYHHFGEGKSKEGGARDRGNFQYNSGKGNSSTNVAGMRMMKESHNNSSYQSFRKSPCNDRHHGRELACSLPDMSVPPPPYFGFGEEVSSIGFGNLNW